MEHLSSPPPHSYRHSRAYRHFKNPPQPHMCIRTTTESGEELFINVLSWTRIVIPQEPSDPIPLYGGMRVPPGSPRSPPIVFAVMANPEVLKDSGRHSKDPEERRAMVELMCDFVEAMNPGVKLVRNAVILKDRDISGELKDVWNAVQAQRDREREEQMVQQRQQQHYHNITTQQMFPKSAENNVLTTVISGPMSQQQQQQQIQQYQYNSQQQEQEHYVEGNNQITFENESAILMKTTNVDNNGIENSAATNAETNETKNAETTKKIDRDHGINMSNASLCPPTLESLQATFEDRAEISNNATNNLNINMNGNNGTNADGDQTDAGNSIEKLPDPSENEINGKNGNVTEKITQIDAVASLPTVAVTANVSNSVNILPITTSLPTVNAKVSTLPHTLPVTPVTPVATPPVKKDKLGGFLPNGCIFPRFKHNKNKDKDREKDKEKESKGKDKEKTLLNALKKSKDKKIAPSETQLEKTPIPAPTPAQTSATTTTAITATDSISKLDSKSQYEKNFLNLENEVQKLDLNKIDGTTNNDNGMFINLKISPSTPSPTAK